MEHTCVLVRRIGNLLLNDKFSDIALIVGSDVLPAHKAILASSCDYFRYLEFAFADIKSELQFESSSKK